MVSFRTIFCIFCLCFMVISCGGDGGGGGGGDSRRSPSDTCRSNGGEWQNGQCCDAGSCGTISGSLICQKQGGGGRWLDAGNYRARIVNLGCGEAISSGSWHKCSGFDIVSASRDGKTHQFICFGSTIAECSGEQFPLSDTGQRDRTGASKGKSGVTYYCASDATWTPDLDSKDAISCEKSGYVWTNSLCCSEADDQSPSAEYYNDPGGAGLRRGACWESKHMDDGFFPTESDPKAAFSGDVINYKGTFFGCIVGDAETGKSNGDLLSIEDKHEGSQLIKNKEVCTVLQDGKGPADFFCSVNGVWKEIDRPEPQALEARSIKSLAWAAEEGDQLSECCSLLDCWDGKKCIENQKSTAKDITTYGLRCIDGEWTIQDVKYTWNFFKKGFCAEASDCLVNPEGKAANDYDPSKYFIDHPQNDPQCIKEEQYILDNYCKNGKWATRTEQIALQLIDSAELTASSYELFCSSYDNVLNYIDYEALLGSGTIKEYVSDTCTEGTENINCVNNFCVIKYEDEEFGEVTAFGTSLNHPVNGSKSFLRALGEDKSLCEGIMGNTFKECGNTRVYYNEKIKSIIVHPAKAIRERTADELYTDHGAKLSEEKGDLNTYASTLTSDTDFKFFTQLVESENIYYTKKGEKRGFGIYVPDIFDNVGGLFRSVIGMKFEGVDIEDEFGIDACDLMHAYHTKQGVDLSTAQVHCEKNGKLQMISFGTGTAFPLGTAWRDLTAKLRLK